MSTSTKMVISNDHLQSSAYRAIENYHEGANLLAELHQELPPLFASCVAGNSCGGDQILASLFMAPEEVFKQPIPARALVLTEHGVLFLEAREMLPGSRPWRVKSRFNPYASITDVGLGAALLTGRFTLQSQGSAPPCEIILRSSDLPRFEAVTRIISQQIAVFGSR